MNRKALLGKGTGILLALVLLLCVALPVLGGGADPILTDAVFTVDTASADAGDEGIVVPVYVVDCPLFVGLGLQFSYDTSALTLKEIARGQVIEHPQIGTLTSNPEDGILYFDWSEAAFDNGEVFVLKFDVLNEAGTGEYPIGIGLSDAGWANDVPQALTGTFVPGNISVDGIDGVALYGGRQYPTLHAAIDAAALSGEPGTVKLLDDITVKTVGDRITIPEGAEITLDMNGYTVTSEVPVPQYYSPVWTVEVGDGAALNLVSTSETRGKFEHATCPAGSVFLLNSGSLSMSNVDVENFNYGIFDGSKKTDGLSGSYGTFEDCNFTTKHRTFLFGKSSVEAIKGCHIEVTGPPEDAYGNLGTNMAFLIAGGYWVEEEYIEGATLELLEDTYIEVNDAQDAIQVSGHIETIKNCTIINNTIEGMPNRYSISVGVGPGSGTIGTITDTSLTGTLSCGGKIDLIEGDDTVVTLPHAEGELPWNWHTIKVEGNANDPAYIGEIAGGTFEEAPGMTLFVGSNGDIGTISGGEFSMKPSSAYYPVWVYAGASIDIISGGLFDGGPSGQGFMNQGTIGEISGGKFTGVEKNAFNNSGGDVGEVSGGEFTTSAATAFNNTGRVEEISGGLFESKTYPLNNAAAGTINKISGGLFRGAASTGYGGVNYGTINEIIDGSFVGADKNGLLNWGGTIGTISGGSFHGKTYAIANTDKSPDVAKIQALSGGYYKGTAASKISTLNADCQKPAGYRFATIPMRESDFGAAGFHHFGETVDITWDIEGETKTDKFVIGDPVYYSQGTPISDAGVFRGWSDGVNEYGPDEELPVAVTATTYEAQFAPPAEDYLVSLEAGRDDINAGEEFAVDVVITSEYNENFYGATVEVDYENDKVDYKSVVLPDDFGLVEDGNVLKIVGASGSESGYEMDEDNSFVLATLTFQAKSNVSTGEAVFSIGDRPIVNQEDAVHDQVVPKGDDLTLTLWNLQVIFKAGNNVDLDQSTAYVKYDEAGLWTDTSYTTAFDEPSPAPHAHHTLDDPLWKPASGDNVDFEAINTTSYTVGAIYTANASPSKYDIEYPESVEIVSGVEEDKVTYLTPVLFTVTPDSGYRVNRVSYTVGNGEPEVIEAVEGRYTIPGNKVTGDIVISVEQVVSGAITFISNDDFYALPAGYQALLLTVESKLTVGAYEYDGSAMFYSSAYSKDGDHVYVYVVTDDVDENVALEQLGISDSGFCEELAYDGNVNLDERLNSTDVVLIYGLYRGLHKDDPNFTKVTMRMRLEADVNGDRAVNTADAQIVLNNIWGTP